MPDDQEMKDGGESKGTGPRSSKLRVIDAARCVPYFPLVECHRVLILRCWLPC